MGMSSKNWKHLLEISVALEITKSERDHLRSQINMLQEQLNKAEARAERAEARLHQTTILMSDLSRQAIVAQSRVRTHNQNNTVAARAMAERNSSGQRS